MLNNTQKVMLIVLGVLVCIGTGLYIFLSQLEKGYSGNQATDMKGIPVSDRDVYYEESQSPSTNDGGASNLKDQKLIKTGSVSMTVNDFDDTVDKIKSLLNDTKGLVVSLNDTGELETRTVNISVKVPANEFNNTMNKLKEYGVTVLSSTENSSDVTMTYLDLQARYKTNLELEKSYISLLSKASKVSEMLEIQRELNNVRQQIEYIQSQIKYYDSQIDMSVISIKLTLNSEALSLSDDSWKPVGIFREAIQALLLTLKGFVSILIWVVVFSPLVIIPLLIVLFIRRRKK